MFSTRIQLGCILYTKNGQINIHAKKGKMQQQVYSLGVHKVLSMEKNKNRSQLQCSCRHRASFRK